MKKLMITTALTLLVLTACANNSDGENHSMTDETMEKTEIMDKEETNDEMEVVMNDGVLAADFTYLDFDGNEVTLADYEGKKLYIKYWASWCPICLSGLERLDQMFEGVDENSDYEILTVVTPGYNGEGSDEEFKEWFNGLEYENIKVVFDQDGKYAKEFNVRAVPTSVFIGSDGVLISSLAGDKSNEDIMATLDTFK